MTSHSTFIRLVGCSCILVQFSTVLQERIGINSPPRKSLREKVILKNKTGHKIPDLEGELPMRRADTLVGVGDFVNLQVVGGAPPTPTKVNLGCSDQFLFFAETLGVIAK